MDISLATNTTTATPQPRATTAGTTILVVDDSRSNRTSVGALLTAANLTDRVLFAEDGFGAFKLLRETPIDLVVCDLDMPRCDGLKFLHLKATDRKFESIPVILLTGAEDVSRKVQALEAGASDYVVKPFDGSELLARISVHLKLRKAQEQLRAANDDLVRLTLTDPLTTIANRRALLQSFEAELARARRYNRPLSCSILDIDHFKRVNDQYGHPAGDAVLVAVAEVLTKTLRGQDVAARFGGEEFAVLLPETAKSDAVRAVERVREALERTQIVYAGVPITVTASFGVASLDSATESTTTLLSAADNALYTAKHNGRNRVIAAE